MNSNQVDVLILGAGWTSTFLEPLLGSHNISFSSTTRNGRNNSIQWSLLPSSGDDVDVSLLPSAKYVIITFPSPSADALRAFLKKYEAEKNYDVKWVLLSSTRPFTSTYNNRHSPQDPTMNPERQASEKALLAHSNNRGCVLHLAGLWGGER